MPGTEVGSAAGNGDEDTVDVGLGVGEERLASAGGGAWVDGPFKTVPL